MKSNVCEQMQSMGDVQEPRFLSFVQLIPKISTVLFSGDRIFSQSPPFAANLHAGLLEKKS